MNFIPPLEISSKIMTLIQEADKQLIMVSPYVNINGWDKMIKCLNRAIDRGVKITFIVRKNAKQDLNVLLALNLNLIYVTDLHAKVYINEKYAIVTSQNIIQYSDTHSIDVAYLTETQRERNELIDFVDKYLMINIPKTTNKIIKISSKNYENKKELNDIQVEKIFQSFIGDFNDAYFKRTATYVFCGDLLPFGDVMIDSVLTVKISKSRTDCEQILKKIEAINFKYYHKLKIELLTTHRSHYYLEFIPQESIELKKLINDYSSIIKSILKSDINKILKRQPPIW
jgi:hypothetical protein